MALFWRFVGILNAAIWLGATVFHWFIVQPDLLSATAERWVAGPWAPGLLAHLVASDFYRLQLTCAAIAVIHFLVDWLHFGRPFQRFFLGLLAGILGLSLLIASALQPHLQSLHASRFGRNTPAPERQRADRSYRIWNAVVRTLNVLILGGLVIHVWRVANPREGSRFASTWKFRG